MTLRILLCLFLISSTSWADPVEIQSIHEMRPHIRPKSLVIFDLDNTIIEPEGEPGSDQWFGYVKEIFTLVHRDPAIAHEKAVSALVDVFQRGIDVKPVEDTTPTFFREIQAEAQKNEVQIFAITARESYLGDITEKHLGSASVNFKISHPFQNSDYSFKTTDHSHLKADVVVKNGIVYSGKNSKATSLKLVLPYLKYGDFEYVFFADDKLHHVRELEAFVTSELQRKFTGFWYRGSEPRVQAFNKKAVDRLTVSHAKEWFPGIFE